MSETLSNKSHTGAWIWAIIGLLYGVSPIDVMPDFIPIAGWVDDIAITGAGIINLIQSYVKDTSETLSKILGLIKWVLLILGLILALILGLLGFIVYKAFV